MLISVSMFSLELHTQFFSACLLKFSFERPCFLKKAVNYDLLLWNELRTRPKPPLWVAVYCRSGACEFHYEASS